MHLCLANGGKVSLASLFLEVTERKGHVRPQVNASQTARGSDAASSYFSSPSRDQTREEKGKGQTWRRMFTAFSVSEQHSEAALGFDSIQTAHNIFLCLPSVQCPSVLCPP